MMSAPAVPPSVRSAENERLRQSGLRLLLVLGVHILRRLRHGDNHRVELDLMVGRNLVVRDQVAGPGFYRAEGTAFDARNLHETRNRVASHAEVMLERSGSAV